MQPNRSVEMLHAVLDVVVECDLRQLRQDTNEDGAERESQGRPTKKVQQEGYRRHDCVFFIYSRLSVDSF